MLDTKFPPTINKPPTDTDDRAAFYPVDAYTRDDLYAFDTGPVTITGDDKLKLTNHPYELSQVEEQVFVACATSGRVTPKLLRTITPTTRSSIYPALRTLRALGWLRKVVVEASEGNDLDEPAGAEVDISLYDFNIPDGHREVFRSGAPVREWTAAAVPTAFAASETPETDRAPLPDGFDDDELQRRFKSRTISLLDIIRQAGRVTPKYLRLVEGYHRDGVHEALNNLMEADFVGVPEAIAMADNDNGIPGGKQIPVAGLYDYVGDLNPEVRDETHVLSMDVVRGD